MNFFKRFTSVFLCCVLLSSFFVVPVSAVDDNNYYSLPPVGDSEPSISSLYPVNPAEFDNNDSNTLTNIYKFIQYLTLSPASWQSNSIIGFLEKIYDRIPSNLSTNFALMGGDGTNSILDDIRKWTMFTYNSLTSDNISGNLGNIQRNTLATADRITSSNTLLGSINDAVSGINGYATESTLAAFADKFGLSFGTDSYISPTQTWQYQYSVGWDQANQKVLYGSFGSVLWGFAQALGYYGTNLFGVDTLYTRVAKLQDVLASDDDKALAESQKENREQIEQDFLSGKSGKTSLGKDDFGSLSGVGGTFKDITSLNGQASIGSFTDGLSSANETGQGWFSQATKDALDSVSDSSSTVSTFSFDGDYMEDADIYNMAGFEDHYAWLWGD